VGDPFAEDTTQGPQVDKVQFDKYLRYVKLGQEEGARLVCGGGAAADVGYFAKPTIFSEVTDQMAIFRDEIFGPVMSVRCGWSDLPHRLCDPQLLQRPQPHLSTSCSTPCSTPSQVIRFSDLDAVVESANNSEFGLAAGVISNDINIINKVTRALKAGTVWVNTWNTCAAAADSHLPSRCGAWCGVLAWPATPIPAQSFDRRARAQF